MKKISLYLIFIVTFITTNFSSSAWGRKGHALVVEIAYTMLDSNTKAIVKRSIENMTAEQAGNWMDEIKSERKFDFMKPWHYLNVEKGAVYEPTTEGNIINALNTSISALEHKEKLSAEDIKKNILIIYHLVGDMHQPLHVGYGSDKGGNDVQVKYLSKESNLHRVWDSEIIESEAITLNDCLLQLNGFDKPMLEKLKVVNVEKWMNQPRSILGSVYNFKNNNIDQNYIDKNKKIIEEQLLVAGIRLAAVLEKLFKA